MVIIPLSAAAYLDPGTGSYIFQLLLATVLGGMFAVKIFWRRIMVFFSGLFGKKKEEGVSLVDNNTHHEGESEGA